MYRNRILQGLYDYAQLVNFQTFTLKWIGEARYFLVMNEANVKHILQDNFDNYPKGSIFPDNLGDLLGRGIFTSDGPEWKEQRRIGVHMFSAKEFRETILGAFIRHGYELQEILEYHSRTGAPIDMFNLFHRFTLDSIGEIAFGTSIGSLRDPTVPFATAFDHAQATVEKRFFTPGWKLLRYFMKDERKLSSSIKILNNFCNDLIEQRRKANDYEKRKDILSRFMAYKDDKAGKLVYYHDTEFLRDVILNFMIAGRDTTAQCLSWAVWLLAQNPQIAEKLTNEAQTVNPNGGDQEAFINTPPEPLYNNSVYRSCSSYEFCPTHRTLQDSMPYTRNILHETLRLYPSVPKDLKQAIKQDVLPDGTVIPAGSNVAYLPYCMGRNPNLWGSDCLEFKPERWNEAFLPGSRISPYKFIAFNAGPRTCLGQQMALVEASFILGLIYRKYSLRLVPGQDIQYMDSLTLPMAEGGVRMTVHKLSFSSNSSNSTSTNPVR